MKLLEKLKKMLIKEKKKPIEIDTRFEEQRLWFINSMPKVIESRADEHYCAEFISAISDHFNPIELENFPLKLSSDESAILGKRLADLMQAYINYRKRNAILLKDFFKQSRGKLSVNTVQAITAFLETDDEYGERLFAMYSRLAHLLLTGSELVKKKEEKHAKKQ